MNIKFKLKQQHNSKSIDEQHANEEHTKIK